MLPTFVQRTPCWLERAAARGCQVHSSFCFLWGERAEAGPSGLAPTLGQQREELAEGESLRPQRAQETRLNPGERGQVDGSGSLTEERVEINNRIGGGAGRRLTLAELQVCGIGFFHRGYI